MIEREKGEKREEERERKKGTKELGGTSVNLFFLIRRFRGVRRATIHGIFRYGDIISQRACPRAGRGAKRRSLEWVAGVWYRTRALR
jgi:hypothetical protein